jgi:hypothetical protein
MMKVLIDDKYLVSIEGLDFETILEDLKVVKRVYKSYGTDARITKVELSSEIPTLSLVAEKLIQYPKKDDEVIEPTPEVPGR